MMHYRLFVLVLLAAACSPSRQRTVTLRNPLNIDREEIIAIPVATLDSLFPRLEVGRLQVRAPGQTVPEVSQWVDEDGDGKFDVYIFRVSLKGHEIRTYTLEEASTLPPDTLQGVTYARFVPERTDDFAWENDRVAFRTYGPEAQRMVEAGEPGGTLSSGIDCWLKRVEYPIINAWYKKNALGGSYHKDDGEGYDPYHVGKSRGCGGLGVWQDDSLYVSRNFTGHRVLAAGPLRTVFELTYAPWAVAGGRLQERKVISIDVGSQLTRVAAFLEADTVLPNVTVGITLHDKSGTVKADSARGWFRYWEAVDNSELGTGVVMNPAQVLQLVDYRTVKRDLSQLYIVTAPPAQKPLIYYAGFAWKKAGMIDSAEAWDRYLAVYAQRLAAPVVVRMD